MDQHDATVEHPRRTIITASLEKKECRDAVISEHVLSVIVNEHRAFRFVCTKSDMKELVVGRLFTEGLIDSVSEIDNLFLYPEENKVRVFLTHELHWEEWEGAEPSCCTANRVYVSRSGRRILKSVPALSWKPEWIFSLARTFSEDTKTHRRTQGTHSCFLSMEGRVLFSCEDIGRHNAVDKAIGYALLHDIPLSQCLLFTSGRVPVDMVQKVISAGIPVLISKAVPTAESIELAREYALTLICRAWPDGFELYEAE